MKDQRQMPSAPDIEDIVLGAFMLEQESAIMYAPQLSEFSFYKSDNREVFKAIKSLISKQDKIDLLTVMQELKRSDTGKSVEPYYLTELTNRIASTHNTDTHVKILIEKEIQRELIRVCQVTLNKSYNDTVDILDLRDQLADEVGNLMVHTESGNSETVPETISRIVKKVHNFKDNKTYDGLPIPLKDFHKRMGGWQPSDLIILAARPSMGKTALALQFATYPAFKEQKKVLVFSLEMSNTQLVSRMLSQELEILANRFTRDIHKMDIEEMNLRLGQKDWVYTDNLIIDDRAGLQINQLMAKAKSVQLKQGLDLVVVDYLQLLSDSTAKTREQEISSISRKLKIMAKDLNIPVIALSQLSRAVESRGGDKMPMLSDLRESGAIEQDADIVVFLNRPEYYGFTEDENGNSTAGLAILKTAKFRGGALGEDIIKWIPRNTRFDDYNQNEFIEGEEVF